MNTFEYHTYNKCVNTRSMELYIISGRVAVSSLLYCTYSIIIDYCHIAAVSYRELSSVWYTSTAVTWYHNTVPYNETDRLTALYRTIVRSGILYRNTSYFCCAVRCKWTPPAATRVVEREHRRIDVRLFPFAGTWTAITVLEVIMFTHNKKSRRILEVLIQGTSCRRKNTSSS